MTSTKFDANQRDWLCIPTKLNPEAQQPSDLCIVLSTTATQEDALQLAHTLVEARLVACAQVLAPMQSVYGWEGKIEQTTEYGLVLKTTRQQLSSLEARLMELHSYESPEFVVLAAEASRGYERWLRASVR